MLIVVNYHYIRESFESKHPSIFGVTPSFFSKQLNKLKTLGNFVSQDDLVSHFDEIVKSDDFFILITFDDGLKEQYELAYPILKNLEIPAIFFINTCNIFESKLSLVHKVHLIRSVFSTDELFDYIEKSNVVLNSSDKIEATKHYNYDDEKTAILKYYLNFKFNHHELNQLITPIFREYFDEEKKVKDFYMSKAQLIELAINGMIGSHSHSHKPLGLLKSNELIFEIQHAKNQLESLTNTPIISISYPYGNPEACTQIVGEKSVELGHQLGFTMNRAINKIETNPIFINRFDCNDVLLGKNQQLLNHEISSIYQ